MTGCYGCEYLINTFGNYVECGLLAKTGSHLFVDWWYWNAGCPDNCPKKGKEKGDTNYCKYCTYYGAEWKFCLKHGNYVLYDDSCEKFKPREGY